MEDNTISVRLFDNYLKVSRKICNYVSLVNEISKKFGISMDNMKDISILYLAEDNYLYPLTKEDYAAQFKTAKMIELVFKEPDTLNLSKENSSIYKDKIIDSIKADILNKRNNQSLLQEQNSEDNKIKKVVEDNFKDFKNDVVKTIVSNQKDLSEKSQYFKPQKIACNSVHNTSCSSCNESPIRGIRYKCVLCEYFDLCEKCEKEFGEMHGHPFYVLRYPISMS